MAADLMIRIEKEVRSRGLKQAEAAKVLGISQPRISDLLRSRIDLFSVDALIDMLARLGLRVRLVTSTRKKVAFLRSGWSTARGSSSRPSTIGPRPGQSSALRRSG
jgi:predicted XRE-type DNA-binding protein